MEFPPKLMELMKYLAAGVIGIAAGVAAPCVIGTNDSDCSGTEVSNVCFELGNASVVSSYDAGSEDIFVLLYEAHNTSNVRPALKIAINKSQYHLFLTLEELMHENQMHFIAMEGFDGEFSSAMPYANTQISMLLGIFLEDFCSKPLAERRKLARDYFYYAKAPTTAAMMFEGTYQERITLFGMETISLFYKALPLLNSLGDGNAERIVVDERSRAFVDNVLAYTDEHPETGNVTAINTGADHQESIEEYLKNKKISFIGIYPDGLEKAIELIESE